jgi:hypothetical protein
MSKGLAVGDFAGKAIGMMTRFVEEMGIRDWVTFLILS